jgi:glycosyltransferase involved in cell wall biosynthesis
MVIIMTQKRKKILFVEQNQDGTIGGSHYCLLQLIRCLDKTLYEPIVMFYQKNILIELFKAENCQVIIFKKPLGRKFVAPLFFLKLPYAAFQKTYNGAMVVLVPIVRSFLFLLQHNIDLVHVNNCSISGWDWLLVSKVLGRKCISHDRGYARFNRLARVRANYFDRILCVSKYVQEHLRKSGIHEKTILLYDGIDQNAFRNRIKKNTNEIKKEFGVGPDAPFIGMIGNLQRWKGQFVIIKAVHQLIRTFPDLVCLLVGGTSPNRADRIYLEELKMDIDSKGLNKSVILTGFRTDVPDIMNALDIVLHSSISPEAFGMVIVEAMCLQKPVVASNLGGPSEIIEDDISGFLVPHNDPSTMAGKIGSLLHDAELRIKIGDQALLRVKNYFNLDHFSSTLSGIYEELLSR